MLILFFLLALLAQGSFTVYRILKERSETGQTDSLVGKILPYAGMFLILAIVSVGGNLFDGVDKRTGAIGASFVGFLWLPRIAFEHFVLHMTHTKNELFLAVIYTICSVILIVRS
jgi:ABC-type Na+ efflux pump permease subunit